MLKDELEILESQKILQENYKYIMTKMSEKLDVNTENYQEMKNELNEKILNICVIIDSINGLLEKCKADEKTNYVNEEKKIYDLIKHNNDISKLKNIIENKPNHNEAIVETSNENAEINQVCENNQNTEKIPNFESSSDKLIITEDKAYLPYTCSEVEEQITNGNYKTTDEVVKNVFTVQLKKYELPSVWRIKEAYKLMRKREKASISDSVKYALELAKERKLHPTIIMACNSQDELDTYLGCLEENKLEYFTKFKVEFLVNPMKCAE